MNNCRRFGAPFFLPALLFDPRRRFWVGIAWVVMMLGTVPAIASGYAIIDLGTLGGSFSFPQAINSSGEVVGFSNTALGVNHGFLFDGTMHDLGTPSGDPTDTSGANGISDKGIVVGDTTFQNRRTGVKTFDAFSYNGRRTTDLGTLGVH